MKFVEELCVPKFVHAHTHTLQPIGILITKNNVDNVKHNRLEKKSS